MNPIKALKTILKQEVDKPRPSFSLIQAYTQALREAIGVESLRLDDDNCSENPGTYITGGGGNFVTTRDGFMAQSKGRRREGEADNALAAMGQLASRPAYDPLASVVQAVPLLDTLYSDPVKREEIKAAVRAEIDNRLAKPPEAAS